MKQKAHPLRRVGLMILSEFQSADHPMIVSSALTLAAPIRSTSAFIASMSWMAMDPLLARYLGATATCSV